MTIKCGKKNDFSDIEWLLSASFGTNWIKRFSSVAYVNNFYCGRTGRKLIFKTLWKYVKYIYAYNADRETIENSSQV